MGPKPRASVSLDADNLWSYLKTHGDPSWESRPSYLSVLGQRMLELFGSHGLQATVFVVGNDLTRGDGQEFVSALANAGHEIANHSFEHEPWLHRYSRGRLEAELAKTEEVISAVGVPRPVGFRGPGFSLSPALLTLLDERGYEYDATTLPTWIGPLARRYYFKTSTLDPSDLQQRSALFGSASEVLRPVRPYVWRTPAARGRGVVEVPVTTMPVAKVPIHASYVLHLLSIDKRLARKYVDVAVAALRLSRTAPSLLLHPLDLLDGSDAPGLEFFPGMQLSAGDKLSAVHGILALLQRHWHLGSVQLHARAAREHRLPEHDSIEAGPTSFPSLFRRLWTR